MPGQRVKKSKVEGKGADPITFRSPALAPAINNNEQTDKKGFVRNITKDMTGFVIDELSDKKGYARSKLWKVFYDNPDKEYTNEDLSRETGAGPSTIVVHLWKLEKLGLIHREPKQLSYNDKRIKNHWKLNGRLALIHS